MPRHEQFGLPAQMRRAAVSVPSNIVEGCARASHADFVRFLDIALASARELQYQVSLAGRLGYIDPTDTVSLSNACEKTNKVLNGLQEALRKSGPRR